MCKVLDEDRPTKNEMRGITFSSQAIIICNLNILTCGAHIVWLSQRDYLIGLSVDSWNKNITSYDLLCTQLFVH